VVLQHRSHVRRLPAPDSPSHVQSLLSTTSGLLGTASNRACPDAREAAKRLQGAGCPPRHYPIADLLELRVPLCKNGPASVHHTRCFRLFPGCKYHAVGAAVLTCQTSKCLNYIDSPIVIPYFVFFMGTWIYLRHYQNLRILLSIFPLASPFPDHITAQMHEIVGTTYASVRSTLDPILIRPFAVLFPSTAALIGEATNALYNKWNTPSQFETVGSFVLNWDTEQYKCWISQWVTFSLLAALQAINLFWLFFICRILWRAIISLGQDATDDRSEYSDDEAEVDESEKPVFVDTGKSAAEVVGNGRSEKH
jgi:hypothetical protein